MNALVGLFIILTSFQVLAAPSLVAFLSQKTNEIRELELCEKASAKETTQLSKTCEKETNSKSFDAISEQLFFDAAAREQIKAYDCVEKQAQDLLVSHRRERQLPDRLRRFLAAGNEGPRYRAR